MPTQPNVYVSIQALLRQQTATYCTFTSFTVSLARPRSPEHLEANLQN